MKKLKRLYSILTAVSLAFALAACAVNQPAPDPLPSWSEGATKQQIMDFVTSVTDAGGDDYIAPD